METIIPAFKDDTDKAITLIMLVLSIFGFIPSLLVFILCKSMISESSYIMTKAVLNLEIAFLIVYIVLCFLNIIPFVGSILCFVGISCLGIINLIIVLKAVIAISKNEPVQIFVPLKLI